MGKKFGSPPSGGEARKFSLRSARRTVPISQTINKGGVEKLQEGVSALRSGGGLKHEEVRGGARRGCLGSVRIAFLKACEFHSSDCEFLESYVNKIVNF